MDLENKDVNQIPSASKEAIQFLENINETNLRCLLRREKLAIVVKMDDRIVGDFELMIEKDKVSNGQIIRMRMMSKACLRCVTCGIEMSSKFDSNLLTIEESIHEYTLDTTLLADRLTYISQEFGEYSILKRYTEGNKNSDESRAAYPVYRMKGFLSEGASIMLMKLFATHGLQQNCVFIGLYSPTISIVPLTFEKLSRPPNYPIFNYNVNVSGIRKIYHLHNEKIVIDYWFTDTGKILSKEQVGSPLTTILLFEDMGGGEVKIITGEETIEDNKSKKTELEFCSAFNWENDLMLVNDFHEIKDSLITDKMEYIENSGILNILGDFMQLLLMAKPEDPIPFMVNFFQSHSSVEIIKDEGQNPIQDGSRKIIFEDN